MPIDIMHRSQELGARIAAARAAQGLSPDALADRLGVRPETVARWEQGSSAPRGNKLQMLAGLLGLPLTALLSDAAPATEPAAEGDTAAALLDEIRAAQMLIRQGTDRVQAAEARLRTLLTPGDPSQ
ncbi:MAG: transcriptional regulator [Confluentimicrobium sp.]|nr:transcriptional regulator [Actibacterium sp.]MBF54349.1 transcriptional regulator [Actibacterium sp.]